MRRILAVTRPIALFALLAATPRLALAQVEMECRGCRPGTEIRNDQLGDFLGKGLAISYPGKVLTTLRADMLDVTRSGAVVGTFLSRAVEVEGGKTYPASTWITEPGELVKQLTAPLKPAEFVIFRIGQWTVGDSRRWAFPDVCFDATHAVRITLQSDEDRDERFEKRIPEGLLCLDVER